MSHQNVGESDCNSLLKRRNACYNKYGIDRSNRIPTNHKAAQKKCWVPTLAAKRCLAFQHCQTEALRYYGTVRDENAMKPSKLLCASYDEAYCFGNPQVMRVDSDSSGTKEAVFDHHLKALRKIRNSRPKFRLCQEISENMNRCIRKRSHVDWGEAYGT